MNADNSNTGKDGKEDSFDLSLDDATEVVNRYIELGCRIYREDGGELPLSSVVEKVEVSKSGKTQSTLFLKEAVHLKTFKMSLNGRVRKTVCTPRKTSQLLGTTSEMSCPCMMLFLQSTTPPDGPCFRTGQAESFSRTWNRSTLFPYRP